MAFNCMRIVNPFFEKVEKSMVSKLLFSCIQRNGVKVFCRSKSETAADFRTKHNPVFQSFNGNSRCSEIIGPSVNAVMNENRVTNFKEKEKSIVLPPYVKLDEVDERFIRILTTLKSRKLREKSGKILLEGVRLINDAIDAGVELQTLFFGNKVAMSRINMKDWEKVQIYKVLNKTLKVWSDVERSSGVMGVFKKPSNSETLVMTDPVIPVTVICENIRDPGNMGSIIRNSAAAGCKVVLLLKGCVDPWELKVLRTGMGAHFRIPIVDKVGWENVSNYIPKDASVYIADNTGDTDFAEFDVIDEVDYVEGESQLETEQRYVCQLENGERMLVDETYLQESHLKKYSEVPLICNLYSKTKFPKTDIVVYVGGETHGVSREIKKLACEFGGQSVKIPLENGVDSLNSSHALSIILYEIKRQHLETF